MNLLLYRLGEVEKARTHFQQAVRSEPTLLEAHFNLANLLYLQKDWLGAMSHFQDVLDLNPRFALAHSHRALLHLLRREPDAALRELAEARRLEPSGFHSALYAAVLADDRGHFDRGCELLDEAEGAVTHPHQYTMLNRVRVRVARSQGNRTLEEKLHLANIESNPSDAHAYGSYADFLLRVRRIEEAVAHYEHATAIQRYPGAIRGLEKARLRMRLSRSRTRQAIGQSGLASGLGPD